MSRIALALAACALLAGCSEAAAPADTATSTAADAQALSIAPAVKLDRVLIAGDIYHYTFTIPIGIKPNAALRIHRVVRERAPWLPRPTRSGALLMHGDFATFTSNFAPDDKGLAPYLAGRELDVWGLDRRWTLPTAPDADVSDFKEMGVAQELDDIGAALAFVRAMRLAGGAGGDQVALIGFSHGAQLAYLYAAVEGGRPLAQRHVKALVPIDIYAELAPEDADLRAAACANSAYEYDLIAGGVIDSPNDFFSTLGYLDRTAPSGPSPYFPEMPGVPGKTNAEAFLLTAGQTYKFAPYTPSYHLAAPVLSGATAVSLRESPRARIDAWFEHATPHQSLRESAELDALWCGTTPPPVVAPLSQIRVPLYYLGAAGAFGAHGVYSTTRVASTDVTVQIVKRQPDDHLAEDYGHGDLLYGTAAKSLAWDALAGWLLRH